METPKQHWLILAHCFNMDGRAASQTITDRLPYLMQHGITPVVVSAPTGEKDTRFPHIQTISPAPSGLIFELRHIIKKGKIPPVWQSFFKIVISISCLPFYLLERVFVHLDSHWSWFITAAGKSLSLIKKYQPVLIYSTAGPSSTHLAGYLLHRITGIPWLAELHDPLVHKQGPRSWQRRRFNVWLEKTICRHAAGVIFFTENALASARQRNPELAHKGHVLRPGANPPDFSAATYKKREQIHFGHFGSLDANRNLGAFMELLDRLAWEQPEFREVLRLDVFGSNLDPVSQKAWQQLGHRQLVNLHGRLEYDPVSGKSGRQRVMEMMRQSDILLLLHGQGSGCAQYIPSKLYEYLMTRRPILAVSADDSELADILLKLGHMVVTEDDGEAFASVVKNIYRQWQREDGLADGTAGSHYTVAKTVRQLLAIAGDIIRQPESTGKGS